MINKAQKDGRFGGLPEKPKDGLGGLPEKPKDGRFGKLPEKPKDGLGELPEKPKDGLGELPETTAGRRISPDTGFFEKSLRGRIRNGVFMGKNLYIAEKPSVAREFAKALHIAGSNRDGYMESEDAVVTWCVGHLVTMSYPEVYDPSLKRWSLNTLPFLPDRFRYEVIPQVKKQFETVKGLLNRPDVDTIYVCTDSGREGEYIYRLVAQEAHVRGKCQKRVWIDSQTEEEINRGIREAKDLSVYDNLSESAYLRAKEDYLMGINFSRLMTLKYGNTLSNIMGSDRTVISIGRVMTCVLGMVVDREREIRNFVKTPYYRVLAHVALPGVGAPAGASMSGALAGANGAMAGDGLGADGAAAGDGIGANGAMAGDGLGADGTTIRFGFSAEWKAVKGSRYFESTLLYKENGFRKLEDAEALIDQLKAETAVPVVKKIEKKQEKRNAPLLFNLAELQNVCSKELKLSPDETLKIVQELYEKKLVTYPRTDARVLSTAIAKEIQKNITGLGAIPGVKPYVDRILSCGSFRNIAKTQYTDDKQITDHYAIIPTGQGIGGLSRMSELHVKVYERIVRRFLSIFMPPAVYLKYALEIQIGTEHFFANFKVLTDPGYLAVANPAALQNRENRGTEQASEGRRAGQSPERGSDSEKEGERDIRNDPEFLAALEKLKKGESLNLYGYQIKEGETTPPKRYSSGSMILAMENAGQLIEDEELRAQIKGSGIGTSATRAEILKKLVTIKYLSLAKKTQVITPTLLGEMIYDSVFMSMRSMLNPKLTASWEKGLAGVAEGTITSEEYMEKLRGYIIQRTEVVLQVDNSENLRSCYGRIAGYYKR